MVKSPAKAFIFHCKPSFQRVSLSTMCPLCFQSIPSEFPHFHTLHFHFVELAWTSRSFLYSQPPSRRKMKDINGGLTRNQRMTYECMGRKDRRNTCISPPSSWTLREWRVRRCRGVVRGYIQVPLRRDFRNKRKSHN